MTNIFEEWRTEIDVSFMQEGNCLNMDTNLFFPYKGQSSKQALEICNGKPLSQGLAEKPGCPVKDQCLKYAMTMPVTLVGIWGGTNPKERRRLRYEQSVPQPIEFKVCPISLPSI